MSSTSHRTSNKVGRHNHVLVTGAAGAIGAAIAEGFRKRLARAQLTLMDVDEAGAQRVARRLGARASVAAVDLAKPHTLAGALQRLQESDGAVDVLVNCAGIMEVKSFVRTPWEVGERLLNVDLVSPLRLMSLVAPGMVKRRSGCIINVSSMAGVTPLRGCTYYGGAKAGLANASEIAHLELAPEGVHVVTVYPGPVKSELERRARAQLPRSATTTYVPTGTPAGLARLILKAYDDGTPRIEYPALYAVANRMPRIAGWVTARLSPMPNV